MKERPIQHFRYTGVEMGVISLIPKVVYSKRNGQELPISLLVHKAWLADREHAEKRPLIIFF